MNVAQTSVIVSGGVATIGVVVPVLKAQLDHRNALAQQRHGRFDDVVDAACAAITGAEEHVPGDSDAYSKEKIKHTLDDLTAALSELQLQAFRLAAIVGPSDPTAVALNDVGAVLAAVRRYIEAARTEGPTDVVEPPAEQQPRYHEAVDRFLDAVAKRRTKRL